MPMCWLVLLCLACFLGWIVSECDLGIAFVVFFPVLQQSCTHSFLEVGCLLGQHRVLVLGHSFSFAAPGLLQLFFCAKSAWHKPLSQDQTHALFKAKEPWSKNQSISKIRRCMHGMNGAWQNMAFGGGPLVETKLFGNLYSLTHVQTWS